MLIFPQRKSLPVYFLLSFQFSPGLRRKAKGANVGFYQCYLAPYVHRSAYKDPVMVFLIYLNPQPILTILEAIVK